MTLKNPTQWVAPSGQGYLAPSDGGSLTTLSGVPLTTLSSVSLVVDSEIYSPKHSTAWTKTNKDATQWQPPTGLGYVDTQGTLNITDNLGNSLVDNSGNFIVTTPNYDIPKHTTAWTETGA